MSVLTQIVQEAQVVAAALPPGTTGLSQTAGEAQVVAGAMPADVLDDAGNVAGKVDGTLKKVGGVIGTLIVLWLGWKAKGAFAALVSAVAFVAVYVWAVANIGSGGFNEDISDTVDVNGSGVIQPSPPPPPAAGTPGLT